MRIFSKVNHGRTVVIFSLPVIKNLLTVIKSAVIVYCYLSFCLVLCVMSMLEGNGQSR